MRRLTKSDYMRGLQCGKMLWLDHHDPQQKIIPPDVKAKLDRGNAFGDKAMGMFGDYVETTAHTPDGGLDHGLMIKRTKRALEKGVDVLCEGVFVCDDMYCAVDILRRREDGSYYMYEVKDAPDVEPQFVMDAAFQYHVARHSIRISKVFIVTRGADEEFTPHDVTSLVVATDKGIASLIERVRTASTAAQEPTNPCGDHCSAPYRCWYWDYCHNERMEE